MLNFSQFKLSALKKKGFFVVCGLFRELNILVKSPKNPARIRLKFRIKFRRNPK